MSQAGNAAKQVESEFAARKAEILRQEKAGGYDPDKAMDYIAKRLAEGDSPPPDAAALVKPGKERHTRTRDLLIDMSMNMCIET